MKTGIIKLFFLFGLIIGTVGVSNAQSASEYRTHIPFDFTVAGKSFKAGDYTISYGGLTGSRRRLTIRASNGKQAALVEVLPNETVKPIKQPALVFDLVGDRYSLTELRTSGLSAELSKSKKREILARNSSQIEVALEK